MRAAEMTSEDILAALVSFDTTSSKSNIALIDWVEAHVRALGLEPVRVPDPVMAKESLFVTVGPSDRGGICLSGHTDVVPADADGWTSDPFTLTARDGKLYGRGACDMKGYLACCLAKLPAMQRAGLATPIHLILSYDEETTCEGVLHAIRRFGKELPTPIATFVGEPTAMSVVDAHKSAAGFFTTIHGRNAHSSRPEGGANALVAGAMLVMELDRIYDELKRRGDPSGRFDPAYSTVHVGSFTSGSARNIVAKTARLHWEFRGLPDLDPTEVPRRVQSYIDGTVLPYLRRTASDASVVVEPEFIIPGLKPEPGSLAERLALNLVGSNRTGAVSYGTEAGQFQAVGIPTVVCGPGSITEAHQPDEWIAVSELRRCESFLDRLVERCAAGVA
jgi:acetylornithine deacetylase